jgi:hypothetical protein
MHVYFYNMEVPALMRSADSGERRVMRHGKGFGWLRTNERTNESQSLWIGRLTEHYSHTLRTLSHETEGKGGERVKPRQQGVDCGGGGQDVTSGERGLDLDVLPVLVLRAKVEHGQHRRDGNEDGRGGIVHAEARATAKAEHGRLERGRRAQVPPGVESLRMIVLLLVHVHRPDVRQDDGALRDVMTCARAAVVVVVIFFFVMHRW